MSLLEKILDREPQPSPPAPPLDAARRLTPAEVAESPLAPPCIICGCVIGWVSVYRDGVIRCPICEPPPSPSLVAAKLVYGHPWPTDAWDDEAGDADEPPLFDPWDEASLARHGYTLAETYNGWPAVVETHPIHRRRISQ